MGQELSKIVKTILEKEGGFDVSDMIRDYLKKNPAVTNIDVIWFLVDALSILERRCDELENNQADLISRLNYLEYFNQKDSSHNDPS